MNRLTKWNGKKWVLPQGMWREITDRLASYENTGLEPEQIKELQAGRDNDRPNRHELVTASIIVRDENGNAPYVDPVSCCAYLYLDEVEANADNSEVIRVPGVNHLVIVVYRDHWHVIQIGGYTPERGMYTQNFY